MSAGEDGRWARCNKNNEAHLRDRVKSRDGICRLTGRCQPVLENRNTDSDEREQRRRDTLEAIVRQDDGTAKLPRRHALQLGHTGGVGGGARSRGGGSEHTVVACQSP